MRGAELLAVLVLLCVIRSLEVDVAHLTVKRGHHALRSAHGRQINHGGRRARVDHPGRALVTSLSEGEKVNKQPASTPPR